MAIIGDNRNKAYFTLISHQGLTNVIDSYIAPGIMPAITANPGSTQVSMYLTILSGMEPATPTTYLKTILNISHILNVNGMYLYLTSPGVSCTLCGCW